MDIHKKIVLPIFIILGLCFFFSTRIVSAESDRVYIRAAKSGRYDVESQIFIGEGDVEIHYGDTVIRGDHLIWDLTEEELYVTGSVVFSQYSEELQGESLKYNAVTGKGELLDVRSIIEIPKAEGPVFLFGDSIELESDT